MVVYKLPLYSIACIDKFYFLLLCNMAIKINSVCYKKNHMKLFKVQSSFIDRLFQQLHTILDFFLLWKVFSWELSVSCLLEDPRNNVFLSHWIVLLLWDNLLRCCCLSLAVIGWYPPWHLNLFHWNLTLVITLQHLKKIVFWTQTSTQSWNSLFFSSLSRLVSYFSPLISHLSFSTLLLKNAI